MNKNRHRRFVVHEHHASRLHFDFRLEMRGVLKSWALPKGPSMDPRDKRLAVMVPDHPVSYIAFEGEIAEGNYGAGQVRVWDSGTYEPVEPFDPKEQLDSGKLSFILHGKQLCGEFTLVKLANRDKQWLLIKKQDEDARKGWTLKPLLESKAAPSRATSKKERETTSLSRQRVMDHTDDDYADVRGSDTLKFRRGGKQVTIHGVERAAMPRSIQPMLATLVNKPFVDSEWIMETKWDGVRAVCFIEDGKARLISRSQQDITFRYPELKMLPTAVGAKRAILDGEIVVFDSKGASRFQLLQQRIGVVEPGDIVTRAEASPVTFCVFDLVYFDEYNLQPAALVDRKKLLRAILKPGRYVKYSAHTVGDGNKALAAAARKQLEGVVAKHKTSAYVQRRSSRWLKIKTQRRQEVVIGGYTDPKGTREHFGALVVGVYDGKKLHYVGNVGGGFNRKSLAQMWERLQELQVERSPFAEGTQPNERVHWIKPALVGEVKFAEWTTGRQMRQPIFMGLRDDKDPKQVRFENEQDTQAQVNQGDKQPKSTPKKARAKAKPRARRVQSKA